MKHQMQANYMGGLRCSSIHLASGNLITTDAPLDNQGRGEAFSPTDLLSASLACCMFTIMGILAERKGWNLVGSRADILKSMENDPRRVSEISLSISIPGKGLEDKDRKMLEDAARACPVARSLHPELKQTVVFSYC